MNLMSLCKSFLMLPDSKNSIYSDWGMINHGVLQGSILGPLLFILYINDFSQPSTLKLHLYSSPMTLLLLFPIQKLTVFASLNKWIKANKLTLNFDKTNFMKQKTKLVLI
jgi:hypothetical protein